MARNIELGALMEELCGVAGSKPASPLVFWDGYGIGNPHSGVGRYARDLGDALQNIGINPIVFGTQQMVQDLGGFRSVLIEPRYVPMGLAKLKFVWPELVGSVVEKSTKSLNQSVIIHGLSNFNIPTFRRNARIKRVLTIHDLIPLLAPKGVSPTLYLQLRALLSRALRLSDAVVCVSNWTRSTVLEMFPEIEGKVHVIKNGVRSFENESDPSREEVNSEVSCQFLCVSRFEKYKNLELLPRILEVLPSKWRGVVVTDEKGQTVLTAQAPQLIAQGRLEIHTNQSEGALRKLYRSSQVYLHSSLFEGFCLPVAEALSMGAPVVYQKGSAIEEIVSPAVSIGLDADQIPGTWAEALQRASAFRRAPTWKHILKTHLLTLPTWQSAAENLKTLYNSLG